MQQSFEGFMDMCRGQPSVDNGMYGQIWAEVPENHRSFSAWSRRGQRGKV